MAFFLNYIAYLAQIFVGFMERNAILLIYMSNFPV